MLNFFYFQIRFIYILILFFKILIILCYNHFGEFEIKLEKYKNEQYFGKFNISSFSLTNMNNSDYEGYESYNLIFDTGSNILWVQGKDAQMINCSNTILCKNYIQTQKSLFYFVKYRTGSVGIKQTNGNILLNMDIKKNETSIYTIFNFKYGKSNFEDIIFKEVYTFNYLLGSF